MDVGNQGERLATTDSGGTVSHHLHRYAVAATFAAGRRVADVACGEGYGSSLLAGSAHAVYGIDIDEKIISHATAKYRQSNLEFKVGAADSIPLPDHSVELVASFETIEHHGKHELMISEIKRILVPDGLLIMSSPDRRFGADVAGMRNQFHVKELYLSELTELVCAQFKNVAVYGQRVVAGSLIGPMQEAAGDFKIYSGGFEQVTCVNVMRDPTFFMCFASDAPLPNLPWSLFDGRLLEGLRQQYERQLSDLKRSISFRIGAAVTWPLRRLFRQ